MRRDLRAFAMASAITMFMSAAGQAFAQKPGGTLKIGQFDSPASMSIHEESSNTAEGPMMGVFNNLVLAIAIPRSTSGIVNLADRWRLFPAPLGLSGATQ